jgi:nucleoside-diphosphate-sugar epimerase
MPARRPRCFQPEGGGVPGMGLLTRPIEGPVLITGVTGFIGGHVARRLLEAGVAVRGLDIRQSLPHSITFIRADITDPPSLGHAVDGCPTVIHCARWTGLPRKWAAAYAVEVTGTANLLKACQYAGVHRVVHLSSIAAYGPTRIPVITEDTPLWPVGIYGHSKVGAERCVAAASAAGLPVVTLRPGQVYGPGARGGTLEPVRWLLAGRPVLLDGGQGVHHPVYIDHVIDAILAAAAVEGIEGMAFNVADGDVQWRDFYGHYARMCRTPLRSVPAPILWLAGIGAEIAGAMTRRPPGFDRTYVRYVTRPSTYSTERARTLLGWSPVHTMAEAMEETERWLRHEGVIGRQIAPL